MKTKIMAGMLAALFMVNGQAFGGECNVGKVEKVIKDVAAGAAVCAGLAPMFWLECEESTLGMGTPACVVGGLVVEGACLGLAAGLPNKAHAIAGDICDYAGVLKTAPFVVVQNKLKEHRVDFRVVIKHGDDVHQRGPDWLDPGRTSILLSNKLETKKSYTVKARIKRDGKDDVELKIDGVKPDKYAVSVEYQDGEYKIHKEEKDFHK